MPSLMPSLFKYFSVVGGILVAGLIGINAVLEPGGPGPRMVTPQPKARPIRHDPQASLVERLRAEEAAQKAAAMQTEPVPQLASAARAASAQPVKSAASAPVEPMIPVSPVQPVTRTVAPPAPAAAEPESTAAALIGVPTDEEIAQAAQKEKVAAEKARKKRLARERARMRAVQETAAARQQEFYYAQRQLPPPPGYAYAPAPSYGPFGGWGRGW